MFEFYSLEDFYNWLPINKDTLLDYVGVTQEEFYARYLLDGIVRLDQGDVQELMILLQEVSFDCRI